jgi:hypothetical protein
MSRQCNAGKSHSFLTNDKSFENMAKLKYFGTTVTNQNCMHEEIKGRSNSRNASYQLV